VKLETAQDAAPLPRTAHRGWKAGDN